MDRILMNKYEALLTGEITSMPFDCFTYAPAVNQRLALDVIRYAMESFLRWDPYEVRDYLNWEVLKKIKLDFFMRYIEFPVELDKEKDLFYIAWLLYPMTIHLTRSDMILNIYKAVTCGRLVKYPKEFFTGTAGHARAIVCFKYALENSGQYAGITELYESFAMPGVWNKLHQMKLESVCKDLFDSPVDMLHEALSENQRNDFYYHYARFLYDKTVFDRNKQLKNSRLTHV